nr:MAG TPA: hypothetical protein [Caudoviricetes sp.]
MKGSKLCKSTIFRDYGALALTVPCLRIIV